MCSCMYAYTAEVKQLVVSICCLSSEKIEIETSKIFVMDINNKKAKKLLPLYLTEVKSTSFQCYFSYILFFIIIDNIGSTSS